MCGIAAFTGAFTPEFMDVLNCAARRGPDGWGIFAVAPDKEPRLHREIGKWRGVLPFPLKDCALAVAHFRLATFAGARQLDTFQPFVRTGIAVAHNGNIYNHAALKARLKLRADSGSDSEVLAAIIEKLARSRPLAAAVDESLA